MAADYLISSLQPLALDGAAPYTMARFLEMCRDQLGDRIADVLARATGPAEAFTATDWSVAEDWRDLEGQLRNALVLERARAHGQDPARWRRPVAGCSLYWSARVSAAYQEKDPGRRDRLLDQVRWDAAGTLTPPAAPLSAAAALTYAIRLSLVIRRQALSAEAGNATFNRLTSATKIEF